MGEYLRQKVLYVMNCSIGLLFELDVDGYHFQIGIINAVVASVRIKNVLFRLPFLE